MPSKNTSRLQTLNKVMDSFDWLARIFVDFIEQRYKVKRRIEDIKNDIGLFLINIKKFIFRSIVESVLLITGLLALIAGILILLNKIIPVEYVLIGYGLIVLIIVMFQLKTRP